MKERLRRSMPRIPLQNVIPGGNQTNDEDLQDLYLMKYDVFLNFR